MTRYCWLTQVKSIAHTSVMTGVVLLGRTYVFIGVIPVIRDILLPGRSEAPSCMPSIRSSTPSARIRRERG